jgi:recombinational DNA repair protein RecR
MNGNQWVGLGSASTGTYSVMTITATAMVVQAANTARICFRCENQSATEILIGLDSNLTSSSFALVLSGIGKAFDIDVTKMYNGAIYAASPAASGLLSVMEY